MDRREFLQSLGILGAVAATPKFIFDMGANLYKQDKAIIFPPVDTSQIDEWIRIIDEANRRMYEFCGVPDLLRGGTLGGGMSDLLKE